MKQKGILLFGIAVLLLVLAILSLGDDVLTPYVPIKKAVNKPGKYVQIIAYIDPSTPLKAKGSVMFFKIRDDHNDTVAVKFHGVLPKHYNKSKKIVLMGTYSKKEKIFKSDKMLVKCPSKYERK